MVDNAVVFFLKSEDGITSFLGISMVQTLLISVVRSCIVSRGIIIFRSCDGVLSSHLKKKEVEVEFDQGRRDVDSLRPTLVQAVKTIISMIVANLTY
jgi:hypothetical protein